MQAVNDHLGQLPQNDKEKAMLKSVEAESPFVFQGNQSEEKIMQIRGEYLVQISPDGQFVDSGFRFRFDIKFQVFPFVELNQSYAGRLQIEFPGNVAINLLLKKHVEFEHFIRIMEKKGISQIGFNRQFRPCFNMKSEMCCCEHLKQKKHFVIKVLRKQKVLETAADRESFTQYIHILSSLKNKHLPRFQGVYQSQRSIFIIFERLRSQLAYEILMNGHPDLKIISQMTYQLFKSIEYLHKMGIIHKNINPENVMFRYVFENVRKLEVVMVGYQLKDEEMFKRYGKPGFIAPQILKIQEGSESAEKHYTEASDIFSLGCVFHYLLTKKDLFPGKDSSQLIKLNTECKIDYENKIYQNLSNSAKNLLFAMLEVNPLNRITVEQALKHEFFSETQTQEKKEKNDSLETIESEK